MADFIVEDGGAYSDSNALVEVEDADAYIENYGNSSAWSSATTAQKQNAIRLATRYLNYHYVWDGEKVDADQALNWPRYSTYDEDGNAIDYESIPTRIQEAVSYLALKVIEGDTLLEDLSDIQKVKKRREVVGPISEEVEFMDGGESPVKNYQVADLLVAPFTLGDGTYYINDVERA